MSSTIFTKYIYSRDIHITCPTLWSQAKCKSGNLSHNLPVHHFPDSKVHGANMGSTWVLSVPDGPHVGPMNFAIRAYRFSTLATLISDFLFRVRVSMEQTLPAIIIDPQNWHKTSQFKMSQPPDKLLLCHLKATCLYYIILEIHRGNTYFWNHTYWATSIAVEGCSFIFKFNWLKIVLNCHIGAVTDIDADFDNNKKFNEWTVFNCKIISTSLYLVYNTDPALSVHLEYWS